jgi:hypothetical protein
MNRTRIEQNRRRQTRRNLAQIEVRVEGLEHLAVTPPISDQLERAIHHDLNREMVGGQGGYR